MFITLHYDNVALLKLKFTFVYVVSKIPVFFIFAHDKTVISVIFGISVSA